MGNSGPDVKDLASKLDALKTAHHESYEQLTLIDERIKKNQLSLQDLVDIGFLCREMEDLLDEMRKNAKKRKAFVQRYLVMRHTASAMTGTPLPDTLQGEHASASNFRVKKMAELPEFGQDGYTKYMESLGIPKEVIAKGLVKPDWEQTAEHVTVLLEDGKKLPPGLGQTWNDYTCTFTRRRRTPNAQQED